MSEILVSSLRQADVFYQFTQKQLELVANLCLEKTISARETIFEENSSSKELYIIVQGEVEILVNTSIGNPKEQSDRTSVGTLRRGQSFGEIALVDEGLRSATARAKDKEVKLLVIPREKLIMLCETYPQIGYRLMYNLAAALAMQTRNTDLRSREKIIRDRQKTQ